MTATAVAGEKKKADWQPAATVPADKLVQALAIAEKFRGRSSSVPILGMVVIQTHESVLLVRSTNLESGVVIRMDADVQANVAIAVPPAIVTALLAGQSGPVRLEVDAKGSAWRICTRTGKDVVRGIPGDDFPLQKVTNGGSVAPGVVTLDDSAADIQFGGEFFKALHSVADCMSTDDARPTLSSAELFDNGDTFTIAATDGYRLAEYSGLLCKEKRGEFKSLLLPAKFVKAAAAVLSSCPLVTLRADENTVLLSGDTKDGFVIDAASSVIDANYPDYRAIIPKNTTVRATLDAGEFLAVCNAGKLFANEQAGQIRFALDGGDSKFVVWTEASESGGLRRTVAVADAQGMLNIAGNVLYLLDMANTAVKVLGATELEFSGTQATRPMRFAAARCPNWQCVIMPMHTANAPAPKPDEDED